MRNLARSLIIVSALICLGCPLLREPVDLLDSASPPSNVGSNVGEESDGGDENAKLIERIDQVLRRNLDQRQLSSQTHGAWQILHGVLAYGDRFEIQTPDGMQPAIRYLLDGGTIPGFQPHAGDAFPPDDRIGLRMDLDPISKIGQGHRDQWLAILAQSGLPLSTALATSRRSFTLEDWLKQAEFDTARNLEYEFSWTLIPLTIYRPTDHVWLARDGNYYGTEQLLASEVGQELDASVCGGTHRLIGIAMALQARRREGKPIMGVWAKAESKLKSAIELAKQNQNSDGSFSASYLHRPGLTRDLGETLGTTGHVLEFLAFAADDRILSEPWVQRSVRRLCEVLQQCEDVDLECGVLYHALHGLSEYRNRMGKAGEV